MSEVKWNAKNRISVRGSMWPHRFDPEIPVTADDGWRDYAVVAREHVARRRSFSVEDGLDPARFCSITHPDRPPSTPDSDVEYVRRSMYSGWKVQRGLLRTCEDLPHDRATSGLVAFWFGAFGIPWVFEQSQRSTRVQVSQSESSDFSVRTLTDGQVSSFIDDGLWSASMRRYFFALPAARWSQERDLFVKAARSARARDTNPHSFSEEWIAFVLGRDVGRADPLVEAPFDPFGLGTKWLVPSVTSIELLTKLGCGTDTVGHADVYDLIDRFGAAIRPILAEELARFDAYSRKHQKLKLKAIQGGLALLETS